MATFRKRNSKWQVQIRLNGHKAKNRTFLRKVDAKRWAHQTEIEIQHGLFADKLEIFNKTTLESVSKVMRLGPICGRGA